MDGCGVLCWHPHWMQKFANTRWFMIIWGLLGTVQATSYLYFVITLTTIEKRFKIPSQTTGIILSGNEISQILLSLILTYFGGQRNRPVWIAWGVVFSALSCFILAWPHFLYGAGEEALQYTEEYLSAQQNISSLLTKPANLTSNKLCQSTPKPSDESEEVFSYVPLVLIFLSQFVLGIGNTLYYSLGQSYIDDNTKHQNTPLVLAYAFSMRMSGPVLGIGLAYIMLRIYIDPTLTPVIPPNDPRWLGAWWLGWIILGVLMFIFAGLIALFPKTLQKKVKTKKLGMDNENVEKNNKTEPSPKKTEEAVELKNFPRALIRLLRNKLLMYNNISSIFYILGASGFITYMGRVMEVQFNQTSASGSILTGPATILGMVIGFLASGYYITKYKPPPKYLFFWNVIIGVLSIFASLSYTQIGCGSNDTFIVNGSFTSCSSDCFCEGVAFSPVCDASTSTTYYSPCHAGCKAFDEQRKLYTNCTCSQSTANNKRSVLISSGLLVDNQVEKTTTSAMSKPSKEMKSTEKLMTLYDIYDEELKPERLPHDHEDMIDANDLYEISYENSEEDSPSDEEIYNTNEKRRARQISHEHVITPGACVSDCKYQYYIFSIISMVASFISSTGRIGNVLLNFRAVEHQDKAFAQGLTLMVVSLFALIPGPVFFGRVIDSACLLWNFKSGQQGNCQLFDPVKFRYLLHTSSAFFVLLGTVFDLLVWFHAKDLELYGNSNDSVAEEEESPESQPLNNPSQVK